MARGAVAFVITAMRLSTVLALALVAAAACTAACAPAGARRVLQGA